MPRPIHEPPALPTLHQLRSLTRAERVVVGMVGMCLTDQEIADNLRREVSTVQYHLNSIRAKLGTKNRAHLAVTATVYGLSRPTVHH